MSGCGRTDCPTTKTCPVCNPQPPRYTAMENLRESLAVIDKRRK